MNKNFVRQNKATKEWVIYASSRGNRPKDFKQKQKSPQQIPKRDEDLPMDCMVNLWYIISSIFIYIYLLFICELTKYIVFTKTEIINE